MQLISAVRPAPGSSAPDPVYLPTRSLSHITLQDFKRLEDHVGDDPIGPALERIDPILTHYNAAVDQASEQPFFQKSLEQLFADHAFDDSRPPFAMGESAAGR